MAPKASGPPMEYIQNGTVARMYSVFTAPLNLVGKKKERKKNENNG